MSTVLSTVLPSGIWVAFMAVVQPGPAPAILTGVALVTIVALLVDRQL